MVGTITPLVEEAQKRKGGRGIGIVSGYVAASLIGSALLVASGRCIRLLLLIPAPRLLGTAGDELLVIVGGVALYVVAARLARLWLPMRDRQVPLVWRESLGPRRAALAYALVLGFGAATRINAPAFYLVPTVAVFSNTLLLAAAPALLYAGAKALVVGGVSIRLRSLYMNDTASVTVVWIARQRLIWTTVEMVALTAVGAAAVALTIGV